MSGADAFPYPDDDPETIRGLATSLSGWSESVAGATNTVTDGRASLAARWLSSAGALAVAEVDVIVGLGGEAQAALADAGAPLDRYAQALDDARAAIDGLRASYDEADANYRADLAALGTAGLSSELYTVSRQDLVDAHSGRLSELHARYDETIATLEEAGAGAGGELTAIAGRISPAPETLSGDLVRANVLDRLPFMAPHSGTNVIRTGEHVIIDTGSGDDDVRIRRDDATGDVIVLVNGQQYRFSGEEAEDLVIRTNGGSDVIEVTPGVQLGFTLLAGTGNDLVAGADGVDVVAAGGGDDMVIGGRGNDVIDAGGGNDRVTDSLTFFGAVSASMGYGGRFVSPRDGGGNDTVIGGDGNDRLSTGDGADVVVGGAGDDDIEAGAGDDLVRAGDGNDTVQAGAGDDVVEAGAGNDYVDGSTGDDTITGDGGDDTIYAGEGDDHVDGGAGSDYIDGYHGNDQLDGGTGDDVLSGGAGADELAGGTGDDVFYTGAGRDRVVDVGGGGAVYHQDEDVVDVGRDMQRVTVEIAAIPENITIEGSPEFQARVMADLETLASSPVGRQMLEQTGQEADGPLWFAGDTLTIREIPDLNGYAYGDGNGDRGGYHAAIGYNPSFALQDSRPINVLFHEMAHTYNFMSGTLIGEDHSEWYVGPDASEAPTWIDTDGDGQADTQVDLDTNDDGVLSRDEVDRDGDGDVDDDDLDLNGDGEVDGGDGWLTNTERQAVGLPVDEDSDPGTPDRPADEVVDHPDALSENALRREMGQPDRESYR